MTDLSYDTKWPSVVALDEWLGPNNYECKIYFDIETDDGDQQNTAFERCKVLLEVMFDHGLFMNINNPLMQVLQKKTKQKIISLPTEPLDIILAAVIFSKLNAIVEGRLAVRKVKIKSSQGDNIWVHYDEDFAEDFGSLDCEMYKTVNGEKPWWQRSDPSVSDWFEIGKKEIKFHKHTAIWDKTLQWEKTAKENKPEPKWKPKIIDGGKDTKH
jgi:hypothetical protein